VNIPSKLETQLSARTRSDVVSPSIIMVPIRRKNTEARQSVFIMVKPDGVSRRLVGEVLRRLEQKRLKLLAANFMIPSQRIAALHYKQKKNGSSGLTTKQAVDYLTSGPVFISIWQGDNALRQARNIIGSRTDPGACKPGTIRRDFAKDSMKAARAQNRAVRNVVHSSNNVDSAYSEIALWFGRKMREKCENC